MGVFVPSETIIEGVALMARSELQLICACMDAPVGARDF